MEKYILIVVTVLLTHFTFDVYGQGCSDAGFCTINSIKPENSDKADKLYNTIKLGIAYGKADNNISILSNYISYNMAMNDKMSLDLKITSIKQSGNQISAFGLSDAFITSSYKVSDNSKIIAGIKLPFNNANKRLNSVPLPMDYQSSLGTTDLILGAGYTYHKIQFVTALQMPLSQNKNLFLPQNFDQNSALSTFTSTLNFKRSSDILIRVAYPIVLKPKLTFTPGILPIWHLKNDKYTNLIGEMLDIKGSSGITFNTNLFLDYKISDKSSLQINTGMPLLVRKVRPDGLTRSFIATLEYSYSF